MALNLVSGGNSGRVGIAMTAAGEGAFYEPIDGYGGRAGFSGDLAPQVMVPRGVWTVTVEGRGLVRVWVSTDETLMARDGRVHFTRYFTGRDYFLAVAGAAGDCAVVLEEARPPA